MSYPVGRSRFALACLAGPWLAALAAAAAWTWQAQAFGWRQQLAFAAVTACGLLALAGWLRSARGTLAWDGGWHWQPQAGQGGGAAGAVEVALDAQSRLLLRFRPSAGGVRWFWLERATAPMHWDALRRAVYSPASTGAPHGAQPPVARQ